MLYCVDNLSLEHFTNLSQDPGHVSQDPVHVSRDPGLINQLKFYIIIHETVDNLGHKPTNNQHNSGSKWSDTINVLSK